MLSRDEAALLLIDLQEGFRRYPSFDAVLEGCKRLVQAARLLQIPMLVTEQYPKGLGPTAAELAIEEGQPLEKTVFSAARARGFDLFGRTQAIVCGIEAHVCVSQTVLDLLHRGIEVHLPADAVGSRHELDCERALQRLQLAGATVTTVEAALFELLERAGTAEFKAVQRLIL